MNAHLNLQRDPDYSTLHAYSTLQTTPKAVPLHTTPGAPARKAAENLETLFDPLRPQVCSCDGSIADKWTAFSGLLAKRVLGPTLHLGEAGAVGAGKMCDAVIDDILGLGNIDEQYGRTLSEALYVFRMVILVPMWPVSTMTVPSRSVRS